MLIIVDGPIQVDEKMCLVLKAIQLVGIACPVSEILLLSKTVNFPFPTMDYLTMDYSPWSSKNLIDWNRL